MSMQWNSAIAVSNNICVLTVCITHWGSENVSAYWFGKKKKVPMWLWFIVNTVTSSPFRVFTLQCRQCFKPLLLNKSLTSAAACRCVSTCVIAKIQDVYVFTLMAFSQMVAAQIRVLRHWEPFSVCHSRWMGGKKVVWALLSVWACDRAECQYAEKQHLPLALNQLWSVVTLTDQVNRVLQLNGVYD